jgi:Mg2+-importing ATPase
MGLGRIPLWYFPWLAVLIIGYLTLATLVKNSYLRRYGELL